MGLHSDEGEDDEPDAEGGKSRSGSGIMTSAGRHEPFSGGLREPEDFRK